MIQILPEDRGIGKVFWVIAGCFITGVAGIPVALVVQNLTPKPSFDIKVPEITTTPRARNVYVMNTSTRTSAKDVSISFGVYGVAPQISSGDDRCKKERESHTSYYHTTSFTCPYINAADERRFLIGGLPDWFEVGIEAEGLSPTRAFFEQYAAPPPLPGEVNFFASFDHRPSYVRDSISLQPTNKQSLKSQDSRWIGYRTK